MRWSSCEELKGKDRSRHAVVCLRRAPSLYSLGQPNSRCCGPTCVLFLRLGGARAPRGEAPRLFGQELTGLRVEWLTDEMLARVGERGGTSADDVMRLAREFAPAWGGRLDLWRVERVEYEPAGSDAAWLDANAGPFAARLHDLLRASPRGVACQFLLTGDVPPSEATSGGAHWVVVVGVDVAGGVVSYYDPNHELAHHLVELPQREFLAAHAKGTNAQSALHAGPVILPGEQSTALVVSQPDRVHRPLKERARLFQLDPSAWPFDAEDLTAAAAPRWFSDPAVADAAARAVVTDSRSVAVIEYGEDRGAGAFAVVPVAEPLDDDHVRAGELDTPVEELARPGEDHDLEVVPLRCGSVTLFFPGGGSRRLTVKGGRSHRDLTGDPGGSA